MSNIQQGQKVQQKTLTLSDNHFAEMSDNSNDTKNKKRIELPSETQTSFKRQSKPYHDDIAETKARPKSGRSSEIIDDLKKSSKIVSKQGGWHEDTKFPPAPTTSDGRTTARDNRNDMYHDDMAETKTRATENGSRPMIRRKDPPAATTTMMTKANLLHKNDANDEMAKPKTEIRPYRATLSGARSSRFKTTGEETIDNIETSNKKVDGQVGWQDSKLPSVPPALANSSRDHNDKDGINLHQDEDEADGSDDELDVIKLALTIACENSSSFASSPPSNDGHSKGGHRITPPFSSGEIRNRSNMAATQHAATLNSFQFGNSFVQGDTISQKASRGASNHMLQPGAFAVRGSRSHQSTAWESFTIEEQDEFVVEEIPDIRVDVIDDDALHANIRRHVLLEAQQADVMTIDDDEEKANQLRCIYYWAFSLLVALGLVIGLSVGLTRDDISSREDFQTASPTIAPTHNPLPTLELIQNNDYIHCGIQWIPALEIDLCRAMAAAILGDPDKFQTTTISWADRWVSLEEDRRVDVLTIGNTYTMNRDVYRGETKTGFTFSDPYVYDGIVFEGIPEYVECMDRLDTYFDNCFGVRVCAVEGTVSVDFLTDHVDDFNIRLATDYGDMYQMFVDGKCNVIAVYTFDNSEFFIRQKNYTGNYTKGKNYFTNEPISVATRQGDPEFSGFVNWVMRALIAAEEQNITNVTASNFTTAAVFGEEYKNMFVNAIQAVGNYGDIYKKHLEPISPRTSSRMNLLNNGSTGLHYSYPLGQESLDAPNPIEGSKIFEITDGRGNIRCGIMERDGFGNLVVHNSTNVEKWQGMDADYCYALSASLFQGDTSKVVFVNVTSEKSGYQALDDGKVDVFAGSRITLESDVKEESTGKGFTFSMPYFYGSDDVGGDGAMHQNPKGGIAMVTREDDAQFSDFVFWTVAATIIAEEQFITQRKSGDMVEVLGFGPRYKDMHRHAIAAVGNYAEIYNRSVENIIPRQGRNLLNTNPLGPQMVSWF